MSISTGQSPNDRLDYLKSIIQDYFWCLVLPPILLGALATGYALFKSNTYTAKQSLAVRDDLIGDTYKPGRFESLESLKSAQETILEVARKPEVIRAALKEIGPPPSLLGFLSDSDAFPDQQTIEDTQGLISIGAPNGAEFGKTEVVLLSAKAGDRDRALQFLNALLDSLEDKMRHVRAQRFESMESELLENARLAQSSYDEAARELQDLESFFGADLGSLRALNVDVPTDGSLSKLALEVESQKRNALLDLEEAKKQLGLLRLAVENPEEFVTSNELLTLQPRLKGLVDRLDKARVDLSILTGKNTELHPEVISGREAINAIKQQIHDEIRSSLKSHQARIDQRQERFDRLTEVGLQLQSRQEKLSSMRVEYDKLERDVRKKREILGQVQEELADISAMKASAARVNFYSRVGEPQVGLRPDGPGRKVIVLAGVFGGLVIGLGLVMLLAPPYKPESAGSLTTAPDRVESGQLQNRANPPSGSARPAPEPAPISPQYDVPVTAPSVSWSASNDSQPVAEPNPSIGTDSDTGLFFSASRSPAPSSVSQDVANSIVDQHSPDDTEDVVDSVAQTILSDSLPSVAPRQEPENQDSWTSPGQDSFQSNQPAQDEAQGLDPIRRYDADTASQEIVQDPVSQEDKTSSEPFAVPAESIPASGDPIDESTSLLQDLQPPIPDPNDPADSDSPVEIVNDDLFDADLDFIRANRIDADENESDHATDPNAKDPESDESRSSAAFDDVPFISLTPSSLVDAKEAGEPVFESDSAMSEGSTGDDDTAVDEPPVTENENPVGDQETVSSSILASTTDTTPFAEYSRASEVDPNSDTQELADVTISEDTNSILPDSNHLPEIVEAESANESEDSNQPLEPRRRSTSTTVPVDVQVQHQDLNPVQPDTNTDDLSAEGAGEVFESASDTLEPGMESHTSSSSIEVAAENQADDVQAGNGESFQAPSEQNIGEAETESADKEQSEDESLYFDPDLPKSLFINLDSDGMIPGIPAADEDTSARGKSVRKPSPTNPFLRPAARSVGNLDPVRRSDENDPEIAGDVHAAPSMAPENESTVAGADEGSNSTDEVAKSSSPTPTRKPNVRPADIVRSVDEPAGSAPSIDPVELDDESNESEVLAAIRQQQEMTARNRTDESPLRPDRDDGSRAANNPSTAAKIESILARLTDEESSEPASTSDSLPIPEQIKKLGQTLSSLFEPIEKQEDDEGHEEDDF